MYGTSTVHYRTFPYIYRTLPYIYRTLPYIYCTYSLLFIRVHRVFGAPATTFWTDHRDQNFWTDHRHQLFWTDHRLQFFGRTIAFNFLDGPPPSVFLTHRCRSLCVFCFSYALWWFKVESVFLLARWWSTEEIRSAFFAFFCFAFCFSSAKRRGECSTLKTLATAALSQVKSIVFRCPSVWALLLGNLKKHSFWTSKITN